MPAEAPTLPAPPAPAPAAAAPATAAPSPAPSTSTPSPTPTPASTKERDDVFATLDAKLRLPEPTPKPDPKTATPPKPEPKTGTAPTPPKEKTVPEFKMPKEFRDNYEATKKENAELKAKHSALETKIKEWEARGKDTESLIARQKEYETQIEAKNAEIRALKQEASPEFKQKYDEPFNNRAQFARSQIEKLQVITQPATEDTPAQYRPATWEDFATLYQMPPNKAVDAAETMFGPKVGSFVMNHLTKLQEMDYERQIALKAEKEQWKARQAEEDSNRVRQRSEFESTFKKVTEELADTVEGYKDADPTDKELADLRQEGFRIFDAAPANQEQFILKGAHVRHRVAAYGPNMLTISRLKAKVAELETKLAEATPKPPGDTLHPGGEPTSTPTESFEEGLRKAVSSVPAMM